MSEIAKIDLKVEYDNIGDKRRVVESYVVSAVKQKYDNVVKLASGNSMTIDWGLTQNFHAEGVFLKCICCTSTGANSGVLIGLSGVDMLSQSIRVLEGRSVFLTEPATQSSLWHIYNPRCSAYIEFSAFMVSG